MCFFLPETWGIKKFKGEQLHLSHVHASACIFAASEEGIDEALSFIHVQLRKGGGRCQQIPTMSRKYLYLHGYQGKCRGFLDCQIVASMDIIKYTIYIYIMTYHDHYNVIITSILWYLRIFMTEADWGSESQWPSDCDENVGLTGCLGEVQQHQATPTGNVTSAVWILSRNFDISRSLERSRERFLIKTWSLWSEDLCFFEKTLQSEGCGVAEGRWHLRRFPHGHPPKLGDGDTHQWRLQVPLRPLDWNHHWELEANLKIMWVFVGVIVINLFIYLVS